MSGSLTRRQALGSAGVTGVALFGPWGVLPAGAGGGPPSADAASRCAVLTPTLTEGPYWVDLALHRSDVRANSSVASVQPGVAQKGVPLTLVIDVLDANAGCGPFNGAHVDIWHANASGLYSDEAMNMAGGGTAATDTAGQDFLRGYQITGVDSGADGRVQFTTIWPGWYTSRAIHIHVRVRCYDRSGAAVTNYTTQIFFPDSQNDAALASSAPYNTRTPVADPTTNETDTVLASTDDTTNVIIAFGNSADGYRAYFPIALDTIASSTTVSTTARTQLEHVTVSKSARGARSVEATIKTNAAVTVVAELERGDRIIGHARGHLRSGAHTVRIAVSEHAVGGAATLVVKVTDAGHHTATYRHRIHIPARG